MGGMVATPLGRAPGAREADGPRPGGSWCGREAEGCSLWGQGSRRPLWTPAGTSAAVGDKCSAPRAGCQDPMERKAGSSVLMSPRDENAELTPSRRS